MLECGIPIFNLKSVSKLIILKWRAHKMGGVNNAIPKMGGVNNAIPKMGGVNNAIPKMGGVNNAIPKFY